MKKLFIVFAFVSFGSFCFANNDIKQESNVDSKEVQFDVNIKLSNSNADQISSEESLASSFYCKSYKEVSFDHCGSTVVVGWGYAGPCSGQGDAMSLLAADALNDIEQILSTPC